jgi:uncharacterized protein involved in exopolysaccharide biosynthesis
MAVIDTLRLVRELRDKGGFTQEAAEATAEALNNALGEQLATRRDVADLGAALRAEIVQLGTELRAEIAQARTELRAEIAQARTELRAEIAQLGADLRKEMAGLRAELLKWMFAQTFVILGVVAALHFAK